MYIASLPSTLNRSKITTRLCKFCKTLTQNKTLLLKKNKNPNWRIHINKNGNIIKFIAFLPPFI